MGEQDGSPQGIEQPVAAADSPGMGSHRALAGVLAAGCITLAVVGEALVLAHVAGAIGLIMLACGAAAGIAGWVALGAPRTRRDISV